MANIWRPVAQAWRAYFRSVELKSPDSIMASQSYKSNSSRMENTLRAPMPTAPACGPGSPMIWSLKHAYVLTARYCRHNGRQIPKKRLQGEWATLAAQRVDRRK